ncbi:hypothetical protein H0E87_020184, partial [Populus deltoides]
WIVVNDGVLCLFVDEWFAVALGYMLVIHWDILLQIFLLDSNVCKVTMFLHPMGWDAFGLPAEQYAIETGTHPKITTLRNINRFRSQ